MSAFNVVLRWVPALLWMGVIFWFSSQPPGATTNWVISKLAHVFEYGLLAWLLALALSRWSRWALLAWIIATGYAISDELHQGFTPGRHPMVLDVILDSAAAALAIQVLRFAAALRRSAPGRPPSAPGHQV